MTYPYLTYCCAVWSGNYENNIHRIELYQKKIVRIISKSAYNAHTSLIFKDLNLLKFEDISTLSILKIVYKYHHQTPTEYNRLKLFTKNESHPDKYRIPFGRLNTTRFAISYRGPKLWNSLSQSLKSKPTLHSFKKEFIQNTLETYKIVHS